MTRGARARKPVETMILAPTLSLTKPMRGARKVPTMRVRKTRATWAEL